MKNGKYASRNSKKVAVTLLALVLVLGCAIGGTIAWLTDSTDEVVNTFTVGNIDIDLTETTGENYKIIPGTSESKDPTVTVKANSEACWVFVEVEKTNDVDTYLTYTIDSMWTPLDETKYPGVYYIQQAATTADVPYAVLTDSKVSYSSELTKTQIDALYTTDADGKMIPNEAKLPKLTFTAYAIQQTNGDNGSVFTAEQAWLELNPTN